MQKIKTYFNKNNFSFETLFYHEHSGTFTKKKHKTLNKLIKFSGFIIVFLIIATLFLLSSCKEQDQAILTEGQKLQLFILKQPILFK